ncbi:PREDICTED: transmembrane protein 41 homolog isoform X1 [Trachymyrmex septentrionalis]|uniref:transmembrane protein 41 homolog isoform X1 n=1 Tax=Trachymyrmex septentrionalis TaxID=34720 RepID=UPI00084F0F36|nr:PREDICTED: transmembrane protein 41 homolog isoform X1 [Trachymyrmex septentrionalis]
MSISKRARISEMARRNLKVTRVKARVPEAVNGEISTRAVIIVGLIFVASLAALFYVYTSFPDLEENERQHMKLPIHIEDAKNLGKLLERYKDLYYFQVLAGLFIIYIFLQTFAIPGSIFLSILSGFLFRFPVALILVCTCSAIGATLCYLLSSLIGRRLLYKFFPEKVNEWTITVIKHRDNLLNYMLFLRMTPLLPNWFINVASPVIGVPIMPFTVGTFFGVAPPSFVAIQAGQTLHNLTSSRDALSWNSVIVLCVFALFSLLPVLYKQKLKQKFE